MNFSSGVPFICYAIFKYFNLGFTNFIPGQFQLFFSVFSIKQFIHLESLQLIQPLNPLNLNRILLDARQLNFLQVLSILHCQQSNVNQETFVILASLIDDSISLRRLQLSGTFNTLFHYQFSSTVKHLYFNNNIFNNNNMAKESINNMYLVFFTLKNLLAKKYLLHNEINMVYYILIKQGESKMRELIKLCPK